MENRVQAPSGHADPTRPVPSVLSQQELEAFDRDGFVVPQFRLSPDEIGRLRGLILRLVAENPQFEDFLMPGPHVPGSGGLNLKSFPGWMEFAAHPRILDMIEQIAGPDIILRGTAAFYKRAGKGPATAWHRDATGQAITPLMGTHVWIAASDTYVENACLRLIPGSHKGRTVGKHSLYGFDGRHADGSVGNAVLAEEEYDEKQAVSLELESGQMIIFDLFTAHASWPNSGTRERASYALRYMPATSFYDHDAAAAKGRTDTNYGHHMRPLILVRGVNRAGNDLRRGHPEHEGGGLS